MSYKVILKRYSDKHSSNLFIEEDLVKNFLVDLRNKKFWTLGWRILFWKIQDIDILQIFEINYDYFSKKHWYMLELWPRHGKYWDNQEYIEAYTFDPNFEPIEKDITTELILNNHLSITSPKDTISKIKEITYSESRGILYFDSVPFDISGSSQFQTILRIFLNKEEDIVDIADIANEYSWLPNAPEKERKKVINSIQYINTKIKKKFNIEELIWISEKALKSNFLITLK